MAKTPDAIAINNKADKLLAFFTDLNKLVDSTETEDEASLLLNEKMPGLFATHFGELSTSSILEFMLSYAEAKEQLDVLGYMMTSWFQEMRKLTLRDLKDLRS